jgi:hypothetical protein
MIERWCAQGDDFRTFLGDFVAGLPQIELASGLKLVGSGNSEPPIPEILTRSVFGSKLSSRLR